MCKKGDLGALFFAAFAVLLACAPTRAQAPDSIDPIVINGVSIPSDFPFMEVIVSDNPSPGYFFLNNWGGQPYNVILDNTGAPVWYWRTPDRRRDFKVQPNGLLTMLVRYGYGGSSEAYIALDSTYTVVDTMRTAPPYSTDEHELTMLEDGSYFLIGRTESQVDMGQRVSCGRPDAIVRETVIQEFNPEDELVFQWRSWENYDIADVELENLCGGYIRFPHMNAIDVDVDGHILVSSRHLSEVTKIHRQTGAIIWRLGGANSDFTFVNDLYNGFTSQHDIRALGNNRYTVFDNGNLHWPQETRVVEYELDVDAKTATLVWEYRHLPRRYTPWMGNAQRLPGGNTLVNYADQSLPKLVEVRPDGSKALEMDFVSPANTYRAFKFQWNGRARAPYLVLDSQPTYITLIFNKFGDPDVDHFVVYGGQSEAALEELATTDRPFVHLSDLENGKLYFFRVTAVDGDGEESDPSNQVSTVVHLVAPGLNLVRNGDFSYRRAGWVFGSYQGTEARIEVVDSVLSVIISEAGTEAWHIELRQGNLPLIHGRRYRFEFDARADATRLFRGMVTRDGDPWTNYSRNNPWVLTPRMRHFMHDFVMEDPSDPAARIVFQAGTDSANVYLDNVSLKELVASVSVERDQPDSKRIGLGPPYPNPFTSRTRLRYSLEQPGHVSLRLYDVMGRQVEVLVDGLHAAGSYEEFLEAGSLPPGVYFARLFVGSAEAAVKVTLAR